jgi:hypothetical protein
VHCDQQNAALVRAPKAGLEKMDQRHANFPQRNGVNFHVRRSVPSSQYLVPSFSMLASQQNLVQATRQQEGEQQQN